MKNIHVLPTDKPSKLFFDILRKELLLQDKLSISEICFSLYKRNIYITSDEEIEKDYVIAYGVVIKVMMFDKETLYFVNGTKAKREECKKIILTTDQALIKDGIQAIDDDFLEWFVKNPSCKSVRVNNLCYGALGGFADAGYKIIIPKEEPKQETLEEYDIKDNKIMLLEEDLECVNMYLDDLKLPRTDNKDNEYSIVGRIKRLQEIMYSEEDMLKILHKFGFDYTYNYKGEKTIYEWIPEWFQEYKRLEQLKNK